MLFEGKTLHQISEADLQSLIDHRIREQHDLEYKRQMYGRSDDNVREMLKDVCSLANAFGGYLLIGIREEDQDDGVAVEIVGIEQAGDESVRLLSSCLSNIQERILGLDAHPVPLPNGRHIIVVRIPRSMRVPHQITFKGLYQCWKRHGRQNSVMTIDEVREACLQSEQFQMKLEAFAEGRRQEILGVLDGKPCYVMAATPISFREGLFDIYQEDLRKLLRQPPEQDGRGWSLDMSVSADLHPSFHGLVHQISGYKELEIFRNGRIEFRAFIDDERFKTRRRRAPQQSSSSAVSECEVIEAVPLLEYAVSFLRFAKAVARLSADGGMGFWVIEVALYNVKGFCLFEHSRDSLSPPREPQMCWPHEHLVVPAYQVSWVEQPDSIARYALDRIWNAFGYEKAPYFNAQGTLAIPGRQRGD